MKNRRDLNRKLLRFLPEFLRFEWMRKKVELSTAWPSPSLEIKIAENQQELESAFRLLHDSYVGAGYMDPDPSELRVLIQHLVPQTTTIVAKWDGRVVGTLTLIRDNPFGLPLEQIFDISEHRARGRRLAEVSSLAVDPQFRGQGDRVLFPLVRFCIQYARHCFGIHEFVIATTASMAEMYLGLICFEKLEAKPRPYEFVKNTVAVGTYMNCETIAERWRKTFAHRPSVMKLYRYWMEIPTDPRNRMPKRQYHSASDPILTPQLLKDFFLDRAKLARRLTYKEVQILMEIYPFPAFQKVLQPLLGSLSRKNIRLDTFMKADLLSNQEQGEVLNVSKAGLLLRTGPNSMKMGQQVDLVVWLNEIASTKLKAQVRWQPADSLFGLAILEADDEWQLMIEALEREYMKLALYIPVAA